MVKMMFMNMMLAMTVLKITMMMLVAMMIIDSTMVNTIENYGDDAYRHFSILRVCV